MAGLDLKKYMLSLMERLNEEEVQGMGFIAVNHGLTFDAKKRHADVYEYSKGKEISAMIKEKLMNDSRKRSRLFRELSWIIVPHCRKRTEKKARSFG